MATGIKAAILGVGSYVPDNIVPNSHFEKYLETDDAWIQQRTGIKERRIASPEEAASDLSFKAAQRAIAAAGIQADELDLIIVGTVTGDYPFPSTACVLQHKLGLANKAIPAFDLSAACSGFIYALGTARAFVESGIYKNVLIVGVEMLSRITDWQDRSTCILFGDGAGAAVIGAARSGAHTIRHIALGADGSGYELLIMPGGGSRYPASQKTVDERKHFIQQEGREVFKFAVPRVTTILSEILASGVKKDDIAAIVPHQANLRILEAAAKRLEIPIEQFVTNMQYFGNTSAASIPMALDGAYQAGRLTSGKVVLLLAVGAGLTWASAIIDW